MSALAPVMTLPPPPAEVPLPQLPAGHPAQAWAALPARELVRRVQNATGDATTGTDQAVFTAFYYRYFPYLMTVVSNALGFMHDRGGLAEIVDDAFAAFFRASRRFDLERAGTDAGCDRLVRSYLGRLAKWKAGHARSFQKSFGAGALDLDELDRRLNDQVRFGASTSAAETESLAEDPRAGRISAWLGTLREVERDILRTYFLDDHAGRKSDRLPDGVARRLAERHQVTTSNLRHLKRKLRRQLHENFNAV